MMNAQKTLNCVVDEFARPHLSWRRNTWPSYRVFGCSGLGCAIVVVELLAALHGLSQWVMAEIIVAAVMTFPSLVMITKIITGEEHIVYYHHEIAVVLVTALLLLVLRQPISPYLDLTIVGVGTFLAFGRVGCFMVGCCHGRPSSWGVCYRQEHAEVGFTPYYIGVRLFPVQLVESLWVLVTVIVSSYFVVIGSQPGSALAWYVVSYDIGRFFFEFLRGDPGRPYLCGFSQPQWISVILLWCVGAAELEGTLPLHRWHLAAAAALTLAMIAIALRRGLDRTDLFNLVHPRHVREIAEFVNPINAATEALANCRWTVLAKPASTQRIRLACTSLGVRVSASAMRFAGEQVEHFAVSRPDRGMCEQAARSLAVIILNLRRSKRGGQFLKGNDGVFHVLIRQTA